MPRYFPNPAEFAEIARGQAEIVPVYRQLLADRLTPVSAFEILGRDANAFLLESVVGGENIGRFSFIATSPGALFTVMNGEAVLLRTGQPPQHHATTDPLRDLGRLLGSHRYHKTPGLPNFTGGLVGYAGYDVARYYEPQKLANPPADDRNLPDLLFGLYDELVIFDHVDKTMKVVANARLTGADRRAVDASYHDATRRVDRLVQLLQQPPASSVGEVDATLPLTLAFSASVTQEQYEQNVKRGVDYIKAGDIFQFVPGIRLRVRSDAHPFEVYRALRIVNPSPYMFYLKTPVCTLIGSSPELLCRVEERVVTTRPLAGTRRRGKTPAEDAELEAELLADPKERAEHIMLVDLHRNDIGRVCKTGSVVVDDRMSVERYSHVMHISSNVTGELADGATALDALRVSLPVGTVSGAPKIRAMQIIDEMEPTRRGPYGGAVGYLDFAGNMDTCIALRTIVWRNGSFDLQAGAGVVADSVPASEYEECMNKARALLKAVQIADAGL